MGVSASGTRIRLPRYAIVAVALVVPGLLTGGSWAVWQFSDANNGSSFTTGSIAAVTLVATASTAGSYLVPGGTATARLTITNANAYAVTLTAVTGNGAVSADAGHPGCAAGGVVTFAAQTGLSVTVPGGGANTVVDLPSAVSMATSAASACQGATFSIPVTAPAQTP